ncbi:MAG TPA: bifunctional DNA-binding transcriptional regulator/O6-methylguanine-DNA methyltransferase Ada [Steroidobacteraceae bacterium]|nr:bifunctional DNA-binding transcriptional regulator/O6-methylguanine-DNA methyltransferase Ada [Steroidobacteraceae bacterium]
MNTVAAHPRSPDAKAEALWRACLERDTSFDGQFVFAVRTTGIYCRPSCPARKPLRKNVQFFAAPELARQAGFRACKRCQPDRSHLRNPLAERVLSICHYIRSAHDESLTLTRLGKRFSFSPAHLQRVFKQYVGISPLAYAEAVRMDQLKLALQDGASVTDAIYASGFSSSSRVYERAARAIGMTPRRYKDRGRGEQIRFSIVPSALGRVLVAATAKGICAVQLGDDDEALEAVLRKEFSGATIERSDREHADWVRGVVALAEGRAPHLSLPLDIRGTAFQQQVWRALRKIPAGRTRSYAEVARSIGRPQATRAVAQACGANPTALVVPCHRVVQSDGGLGGYHWGIERKRRVLEAERKAQERAIVERDANAAGVSAHSD